MIIDGVSAIESADSASPTGRAVAAFLHFIEKRLGVSIIRKENGDYSDPTLEKPLALAETLRSQGIIREFGRSAYHFTDEPRMHSWYAICNDATQHRTGGTTWENDAAALYAALAEGLERFIWFTQDDYYVRPTRATVDAIAKKGAYVPPESFAAFSDAQRAKYPERALLPGASYLWIAGTSLVSGTETYVPAQVVSRAKRSDLNGEPFIRHTTTNGLATWPTQTGARLAGMLELIEREAYMIMWLNQMTLPRIALSPLRAKHPALERSIATCERYGLKVHAVQMLTDAPAHAVAVVLEDVYGHAPRFTIGLRAAQTLPAAIQKAMTEALRARRFARTFLDAGHTWDMQTPEETIGHRDRVHYWSVPEHAQKLEFLVQGDVRAVERAAWEHDDDPAYLGRLVQWCADSQLECIAVSLGTSKMNPTPWHIEMMIMPQLQPTYLTESLQAFGGTRWQDVPRALGYIPRTEPFSERPHPFS